MRADIESAPGTKPVTYIIIGAVAHSVLFRLTGKLTSDIQTVGADSISARGCLRTRARHASPLVQQMDVVGNGTGAVPYKIQSIAL